MIQYLALECCLAAPDIPTYVCDQWQIVRISCRKLTMGGSSGVVHNLTNKEPLHLVHRRCGAQDRWAPVHRVRKYVCVALEDCYPLQAATGTLGVQDTMTEAFGDSFCLNASCIASADTFIVRWLTDGSSQIDCITETSALSQDG